MKSMAPPISNSHLGMKGMISMGLGMKSYTALNPLYSIVPSDTKRSHSDLRKCSVELSTGLREVSQFHCLTSRWFIRSSSFSTIV